MCDADEQRARRAEVRVLILTGLGLNCEAETEAAFVARARAPSGRASISRTMRVTRASALGGGASRSDGTPMRWIFSEITPGSFRWTGESLQADGVTWKLEGEFRAKRRR